MGVKHLWDILDSCKKTLPLEHLRDKRVCIDLSCWIVQLHNVNKSHCSTKDKVYLRGLFHRLRALLALNCTIILVADGAIPAIKLSTYRRRLNSESKVSQDETNSDKASSLQRNMGSEFSGMIKEANILGMALGIPCIISLEEAEAQCALLNSESLCDGCFTSDSDIFLFGARTVYRDICLGEGGYVVCYEMNDIETKLGFGRNSLITLALLLGSDYTPGVRKLGQEAACQIVKSIGECNVLQRVASDGLSFANKPKVSKKQNKAPRRTNKENYSHPINENVGPVHDLPNENQYLAVIEAYLRPKCHTADSSVVQRALGGLPFDRLKLQNICARYFEWPPEKTDEYILPKIAERKLRQFANLRSTSSALGLGPPLDKMPVRCPLLEIIKHRKVLGRESFEVSWEDIDGLKTSVVPADLIECACPEKRVEFEEKRAQAKKQNIRKPRIKKSEKEAPISEIDKKLQDLLLDIENEHIATQKAVLYRQSVTEKASYLNEVCQTDQSMPLSTGSKSNLEKVDQIYNSSALAVQQAEVIDLLSPSPPMRARKVAKCQEANVPYIPNVAAKCQEAKVPSIEFIDLSDTENELSPEHTRKARELRIFLNSIRGTP
ncbi:single-strand DNA endonuclease 1 isoform X1 [Daucus carota subsp. sativus]|uniref:single-strand DNA endonuclease 1 isoform X1 n=2 Tax=Daucus carota subsp. sativus TaxID=79200 RepID=UPI0007F04904|nr:PREDICTED: flap endonuclease GEN-like 2 isoform X1 [Daucus carota subsp. sativus]